MIRLEASAEIPWLSRDLWTTVPVWDIGGESLSQQCFPAWEEDWVVGQHLHQHWPPCLSWPFWNKNDPLNFFLLNLL